MQEAFRRAKIDVPLRAKFDWNAWLKDGGAQVNSERRFLAHHLIRALFRVGEDERAGELVAALIAVIKEHSSEPQWQQEALFLIDVAVLSARPETCDEIAAKLLALNLEDHDRVVSGIYRHQNPIAVAMWKALHKQFPGEDQVTALKHLRRLLTGNHDAKSADEFVALVPRIDAELASENAAAFGGESADVRAGKLLAVAALLHRHEQSKLTAKYLARAQTTGTSSQTLTELGDLYAEEKLWNEAIRAYEAAWNKDRRNASALYLLGWARSKHGEDAQGRQQMELALMIPLGDGDSRRILARTLARLHVDDEAAKQRKLVLQLAAPHETSIIQVLDELCDSAAESAAAKKAPTPGMALLSQRLSAEFLFTPSVFMIETRYFMQWRASAHRIAARELLRAGKKAAAIEEIHKAEAILPEDVEVPLDCDADLRKQGAVSEADALYHRMADRLRADSRVFPRYATSRNDLAWLAANLDRDLDMALANAQRAVELAPQSPGILDTLAEVQFRRGNRAQAILLARRCVELDGDGPTYKERLAHFGEISGTSPNPTASTPP
jgi:tetratricopeptide (TPR) repeat protein